MDVVWTGEFAQAGWMFSPGELTHVGSIKDVLKGPFDCESVRASSTGRRSTATPGCCCTARACSGTGRCHRPGTNCSTPPRRFTPPIQETGKRSEALVVLFDALLESAGGSIVASGENGKAVVALPEGPTVKALEIMKRYATSSAARRGC